MLFFKKLKALLSDPLRLVLFLLFLFVLIFGGVWKMAVLFYTCIIFFLGWNSCKIKIFVSDYLLYLRINRIKTDKVKYEDLKKENNKLTYLLRSKLNKNLDFFESYGSKREKEKIYRDCYDNENYDFEEEQY